MTAMMVIEWSNLYVTKDVSDGAELQGIRDLTHMTTSK